MINKIFYFTVSLFLFLLPLYFLPFGASGVEYDKQVLLILFSLITFFLLLRKILLEKKVKIISTLFTLPLILLAAVYLTSTIVVSPNKIDSFISPMGSATIVAAAILYLVFTQISFNIGPLILSSSIASLIYLLPQLPLNLSPLGFPLSAVTFLLPIIVYLGAHIALHFGRKNLRLSFKLIKPVILPALAILTIASSTAVLSFRLITDQKPLLLPFSFAWTIMMESAKNFPKFLFGVGPANFISAYSLGKPVSLNLTPFWNILFYSSSNLPFTIATEAGIIAAAIFIFIVIKLLLLASGKTQDTPGAARRVYPVRNSPGVEGTILLTPYLLALITAIILQFLLPSNIALFILTIILLSAVSPKKEAEFDLHVSSVYLLLPIGLVSLIGLVWGGKFYLADFFYRNALSLANRQKIADSYNLSQTAIRLNPASDRYLLLSSALSFSIARNLSQTPQASSSSTQQDIVQLTQQAITHARNATILNNQNPQNWAQLASVYQNLVGTVQGADQSTLDALSIQIALDPASPQPRLAAANVFAAVGQLSASQSLLTQAINLKPDWIVPHYNLATIFAQSQAYREAAAELAKVLDLTPIDSADYKRVQQQLESIKELIPKESTPSAVPSATPSSNLKKMKPSPSPIRNPG